MKKGDILVSSWGYDQTNIDFYEVVKVTEKTATLIELKSNRVEDGYMHYRVTPIPGSGHGKPFRRRILGCLEVPACRINDSEFARLWDGTAKAGTSYA